jgi:hypothetical protein
VSPVQAALVVLAAELRKDIEAAAEKVRELEPYATAQARGPQVYIPAAVLHHFYTAIESMFDRIFATFEGRLSDAPDSHAQLLNQARLELPEVRPAVIGSSEFALLEELRSFRHLFRNGYGIALKPARLQELAALTVKEWPGLEARFSDFLKFVDACAARAS